MKLKITAQYVIAFIALNMIMGELHEQAHITTGYLICGCYGPRDFSVWSTCEHCAHPSLAFLATAAGPLFSCALMWLGALWFTRSKQPLKQSFGFSLLFANLPFARIFTAFMGGGDEKVVFRYLFGENTAPMAAHITAAIVVTLICLPPIVLTAKKLANQRRWLIVSCFLVLPLIFGMLYQRMLLNGLLKKGIGDHTYLLGTPSLILLHFMLMVLLFVIFRKRLLRTFTPPGI